MFQFTFDKETCGVNISRQGDLDNPVWVSDNTVLRFGNGDVDSINIMTSGNVVNFPKVTDTLSTFASDCRLITNYENTTFYIGGEIDVTDGSDGVTFIMTYNFEDL